MAIAKKTITIEGKQVKLAHMRSSKKGAEVVGARYHVKGLGTVYVQVYEAMTKIDEQRQREAVKAHLQALETPPQPAIPTFADMSPAQLRALAAAKELAAVTAPRPPAAPIPAPPTTAPGLRAAQVSPIDQMIVDTLNVMSKRLAELERARLVGALPGGPIPDPRPSNGHSGR